MVENLVAGYYVLTVYPEDRGTLTDAQRNDLAREYPTAEEASKAKLSRENEWHIRLTVQPAFRPR